MEDNSILQVDFSQNEINTIRNTVAKGASNEELNMFLHLCKTYGLDPFAKEIWFIKYRDQTSIITSRDGYLKIANRNPHFKGMDSDVVYSGDNFSKTKDGVIHTYGIANRGKPVGAYALVYRDDRNIPSYFYAPIADYSKSGNIWTQYPHAMILKVAEAMALKRAFSISGLVTQEEFSENSQNTQTSQPPTPHNPNEQKLKSIYSRYLAVFDNNKDLALDAIKSVIGDTPSSELSEEQIFALDDDVRQRELSKFINNSPAFKKDNEEVPNDDNSLFDCETITVEEA